MKTKLPLGKNKSGKQTAYQGGNKVHHKDKNDCQNKLLI